MPAAITRRPSPRHVVLVELHHALGKWRAEINLGRRGRSPWVTGDGGSQRVAVAAAVRAARAFRRSRVPGRVLAIASGPRGVPMIFAIPPTGR